MFYFTTAQEIDFSFLKNIKFSVMLYSIIQYIWSSVFSLTLIYFCMVIGKVALKGKKLGKVGSFIIFIALTALLSWLTFKIETLFPQTITLGTSLITDNFKSANSNFSISGGVVNINIAGTISEIIAFAGFFISTVYVIDNKLDLS
jgi:ABC-2 type transport system permease protein